jgi:hypothetical protein
MLGATSPARDPAAIRSFYMTSLSFREIASGLPARLTIPGDSGQELDIVAAGPDVKTAVRLGVADVKLAAGMLAGLGLSVKSAPANNPTVAAVADPDGVVISFVKVPAR